MLPTKVTVPFDGDDVIDIVLEPALASGILSNTLKVKALLLQSEFTFKVSALIFNAGTEGKTVVPFESKADLQHSASVTTQVMTA